MFGSSPNGGAGQLAKFIRKISFMAKRRINGAVHDQIANLFGIRPAEFRRAARE
jgi:hypothetical protein